jgi:hypothetical protein
MSAASVAIRQLMLSDCMFAAVSSAQDIFSGAVSSGLVNQRSGSLRSERWQS